MPTKSHGTNTSYTQGCRCDECRAAHAIANKPRNTESRQELQVDGYKLKWVKDIIGGVRVLDGTDPELYINYYAH